MGPGTSPVQTPHVLGCSCAESYVPTACWQRFVTVASLPALISQTESVGRRRLLIPALSLVAAKPPDGGGFSPFVAFNGPLPCFSFLFPKIKESGFFFGPVKALPSNFFDSNPMDSPSFFLLVTFFYSG